MLFISPPPKLPPMQRRQPYRLMNPLTGIWPAYGDAISYRYVSPDGDEGRNNQHLGARHVSATMLPQLGDNTHILFTATPPQCDGASTTLNSPLSTLNSSHTFSAKERDAETGLSYFGARYYSGDLSIWLSVDPMSDKYPSLSPYVYCANNPVKLVDPNGEDWYESEDGKSLIFIYGETGQREGYKNLGAHLGQDYKDKIKNGAYSTVSMSANFGNDDFVAQKAGECCKAAKQMCSNRGGENSSYANELPIVSAGVNGEAGGSGIPENFVFGIEKLCSSLEKGVPVVAGVDYGPGSNNSTKKGGDGMTDHYVAIIGVTLNFSKNNLTGETSISGGNLRYANPGNNSSSEGLNPSNLFTINVSKNYRVERYVNNGVCFTVTNLRVK